MNSTICTPSPSSMSSFVKPKKSKKVYKYRSKNGDLWAPAKGWLRSYRCAACKQIMSRKQPTTCPQLINYCGHITCAKCIVKSFLIDLNPSCPVEGCCKLVNTKQTVEPVTLVETPPEETTHHYNQCEEEDLDYPYCDDYECEAPSEVHYCGDAECKYDCGVLWCGCIDICRGRCGMNDYIHRW